MRGERQIGKASDWITAAEPVLAPTPAIEGSFHCHRLYRNRLRLLVNAVDTVKAIASSGAIGAWVIWKEFPLVWAFIIVVAQIVDALKGVFPFAKEHKAASELTAALETLYIDAEEEWYSIYSGTLSADLINKKRSKIMKLQSAAEHRHFPDGFELSPKVIAMAEKEALRYFEERDLAVGESETDMTSISEDGD